MDYEQVVKYAGLRNPKLFLAAAAIIVAGGLVAFFLSKNLLFLVVALALADVVAMGPYYLGKKKIEEVERELSEALKQMSSILRSGGTFEVAVKEIALSDYGQLSREFAHMLREMEGGLSFVAALQNMARRVNSRLLKRVVIIITGAVRTGGRVADVLDEIADDVRAYYRTRIERRTRTTMQFFFLFASAAILGPFLVGVSMGILQYMTLMGKGLVDAGTLSPQEFNEKLERAGLLELVLQVFVLLESLLASFMAAVMREGRLVYGVAYAPLFLLLAYLSMLGGRSVVLLLT